MSGEPTRRYALALLLCGAAALGIWMQPNQYAEAPAASLEVLIPHAFGDWHEIQQGPTEVDPSRERGDVEPSIRNPYDDVLLRSYVNADGVIMQLALAYGRHQRQEVKIHRPELCYTAQGFKIRHVVQTQFAITGPANGPITGARMLTEAPGRIEAVSYWIRIGSFYSDSAWAIRYHILKEGLKGRVDDGVLVRASQIISGSESDIAASYSLQNDFLRALVASLPQAARRMLVI
jgi:EpsI family protein